MSTTPRLAYLDNLRCFVVMLVVVMHSNVTYSGMGSWYYVEGHSSQLGLASTLAFALYGCFTQAWFMGLLFFLSGYLAARALMRHGTATFIRERLFRLGAPLLFYMLVVHPLTVFAFLDHGRYRAMGLRTFYQGFLLKGHVLSATGPLWFAEALLIFCLLYAALRRFRPIRNSESPAPTASRLLILALGTGLFAAIIRFFWPIGTNVLNLQFCFFASYIILFILGVQGGEHQWFKHIPTQVGSRLLRLGLGLGIPAWLLIIALSGALQGRPPMIEGGWHWQAIAYALWEAFVAITLSFGLVVFFREHLCVDRPFTRLLSRECFRVYMFHTPVLVSLSLALASWHAPLLAKHLVVAPLACAASLGAAILLGRIPLLRAITR